MTPDHAIIPDQPTTMRELTSGEQLVIWTFRRWAGGGRQWPMVWREFHSRFQPAAGRAALAAFVRVFGVICGNASRTIRYHQPCCPCVSPDELLLSAIIGAAQQGDIENVRGYARDLVVEHAADELTHRVFDLSQAFADRSVMIPDRLSYARPVSTGPAERPLAATVH